MKNKSPSGLITIEFIFSFSIAIFLFYLVFMVALTFVAAEAAQYISFSSSRAFFAGDESPEIQEEAAIKKFEFLTKENKVFKSMFGKPDSFFSLKMDAASPGNIGDELGYVSKFPNRVQFVGVRLNFISKVLNFKVPILGSTGIDENGFSANINSFLYREVSSFECQILIQSKDRWKSIEKKLNGYSRPPNARQITLIPTDNGC